MNLLEIGEELKAIGFVPSYWEYIETDLTPNRVFQPQIRKLSLQLFNQLLSNKVFFVINLKVIPLFLRALKLMMISYNFYRWDLC